MALGSTVNLIGGRVVVNHLVLRKNLSITGKINSHSLCGITRCANVGTARRQNPKTRQDKTSLCVRARTRPTRAKVLPLSSARPSPLILVGNLPRNYAMFPDLGRSLSRCFRPQLLGRSTLAMSLPSVSLVSLLAFYLEEFSDWTPVHCLRCPPTVCPPRHMASPCPFSTALRRHPVGDPGIAQLLFCMTSLWPADQTPTHLR